MDRVGLGRALGFGARQAARTLIKVADAATTPSPTTQAAPPRAAEQPEILPAAAPPAPRTRPAPAPRRASAAQLGKAVLKPVARFTGVLWLEVTGSFYAIFTLVLGTAAWRQWKLTQAPAFSGDRSRLYLYIAVAAVFAYFALSNFIKAHRRGRQP